VSKGKSAAAAATSKSGVNLGIGRYSPDWPDSDEVAHSVGEYVDRDEEEEDDEGAARGRLPSRVLSSLRERSLSPRLYELVGRAFIQYFR
jgi:hypothetical protein